MRQFVSVIAVVWILGAFVAAPAHAITLDEVVRLSSAGVSPAVVVALIEANNRIYRLTTERLLMLMRAGVPEQVLLALARSGRQSTVPLVIGRRGRVAREREARPHRPADSQRPEAFLVLPDSGRFRPLGLAPAAAATERRRAQPRYWGFGGQRRPGSWDW